MKRDIFHNASLKLASLYVLIIMSISFVFSIWVYNVAFREIRSGIMRRPGPVEETLRRENRRFTQELYELQEQAIVEAKERLRTQIVLLNLALALGSAAVSYYLARRTLMPIQQAHRALQQFTADASHELRTPITAMRLETEVTLDDPKLTLAQARRQLENNIEELDKLTSLSGTLLNLARLEEGTLSKQPTELKAIITTAVERVSSLTKTKQQDIDYSTIQNKTLLADAPIITEALVVLLENASKYSPKKSHISVTTTSTAKSIAISVTDNGKGINEQDLPHIFDRFYQADVSRTKDNLSGFGIGLAIAQAAVTAHQGKIYIANTSKKGTTITIQLPLS